MERSDGRKLNQTRKIKITRDVNIYAEGSCIIECGNTKVLCTASVEERVPPHLKDSGTGWVTAEYNMLPRATSTRNQRDISKLRMSPRSVEIQRLIGRSLRAVCDLSKLGERSVTIDCDVLQADGGTRTASITGGYVAMRIAFDKLVEKGIITENPVKDYVAAISCGIVGGTPMLDLCYTEDSAADVDANIIMTGSGKFVELQMTGEEAVFSKEELDSLLKLGKAGINFIVKLQKKILGDAQ